MKKVLFSIAALAVALGFTACSNEDEALSVKSGKTTVLAMTETGTRTALESDGEGAYNVVWSEGDKITIGDQTFTLEKGAGSTAASFTGTAPADGSYTAYYATTDGTVPTSQTYTAGEISNFPMVATATVTDGEIAPLSFTNVGGLLQLTVKEDSESDEYTIKSVKVSADQLSTSITLDCGTGVELDGSMVFNIAMPIGTYTGVTIKLYTTGPNTCTKTFKGTSGLVIERSKITKASFKANFEYGGLCFTAVGDDAGVTLTTTKYPNLKYSTDGVNWTDVEWNGPSIPLSIGNVGNKLYLCGDNPEGLSESTSKTLYIKAANVAASGNIMSLIDPTCQTVEIPNKYCFYKLFASKNNTLTTAPELPATTLTEYCYSDMFNGCINLTKAPELPATTLTKYCYNNMFKDCTVLTTAPDLPATTLADHCYYNMFNGCKVLTTAPELPATTLASYCYDFMFSNCTELTTAPELPATTLASNCYGSMFMGCKKLNYVKVHFTDHTASACLSNWLSNVASSGTFYKPAGLTDLPTGAAGIPSGWKVVDF